jgi:hypothetical protein
MPRQKKQIEEEDDELDTKIDIKKIDAEINAELDAEEAERKRKAQEAPPTPEPRSQNEIQELKSELSTLKLEFGDIKRGQTDLFNQLAGGDDIFMAILHDIQIIAGYAGQNSELKNDTERQLNDILRAVGSGAYEFSEEKFILLKGIQLALIRVDSMASVDGDMKRMLNIMTEKIRTMKEALSIN